LNRAEQFSVRNSSPPSEISSFPSLGRITSADFHRGQANAHSREDTREKAGCSA
jgi:hypothetical protein